MGLLSRNSRKEEPVEDKNKLTMINTMDCTERRYCSTVRELYKGTSQARRIKLAVQQTGEHTRYIIWCLTGKIHGELKLDHSPKFDVACVYFPDDTYKSASGKDASRTFIDSFGDPADLSDNPEYRKVISDWVKEGVFDSLRETEDQRRAYELGMKAYERMSVKGISPEKFLTNGSVDLLLARQKLSPEMKPHFIEGMTDAEEKAEKRDAS